MKSFLNEAALALGIMALLLLACVACADIPPECEVIGNNSQVCVGEVPRGSLDSNDIAILGYMAREANPDYYFAYLESVKNNDIIVTATWRR